MYPNANRAQTLDKARPWYQGSEATRRALYELDIEQAKIAHRRAELALKSFEEEQEQMRAQPQFNLAGNAPPAPTGWERRRRRYLQVEIDQAAIAVSLAEIELDNFEDELADEKVMRSQKGVETGEARIPKGGAMLGAVGGARSTPVEFNGDPAAAAPEGNA